MIEVVNDSSTVHSNPDPDPSTCQNIIIAAHLFQTSTVGQKVNLWPRLHPKWQFLTLDWVDHNIMQILQILWSNLYASGYCL